ncbi:cytochrome b562, partial [Acinetobacter baumannii]
GYHAGLDQLVAEIDKTNLLVKAGKLDQAKIEGKKLIDSRNINHKKFK